MEGIAVVETIAFILNTIEDEFEKLDKDASCLPIVKKMFAPLRYCGPNVLTVVEEMAELGIESSKIILKVAVPLYDKVMQRYAVEVEPLLRKSWDCFDELKKRCEVAAVEQNVPTVRDVYAKATTAFDELVTSVPFCIAHKTDSSHCGRWIPLATRDNPEPMSIQECLFSTQQVALNLLKKYPTEEFNARLPKEVVNHVGYATRRKEKVAKLEDCLVCRNPTSYAVYFCPGSCSRESIVCYDCLRTQSWTRQYDEFTLFSDQKPLRCFLCNRDQAEGSDQVEITEFERTNGSKRVKH